MFDFVENYRNNNPSVHLIEAMRVWPVGHHLARRATSRTKSIALPSALDRQTSPKQKGRCLPNMSIRSTSSIYSMGVFRNARRRAKY